MSKKQQQNCQTLPKINDSHRLWQLKFGLRGEVHIKNEKAHPFVLNPLITGH